MQTWTKVPLLGKDQDTAIHIACLPSQNEFFDILVSPTHLVIDQTVRNIDIQTSDSMKKQ